MKCKEYSIRKQSNCWSYCKVKKNLVELCPCPRFWWLVRLKGNVLGYLTKVFLRHKVLSGSHGIPQLHTINCKKEKGLDQ